MIRYLLDALQYAATTPPERFFVPDGRARLMPHAGGEQPFDRMLFVLSGVKREAMSLNGEVRWEDLQAGDVYLVGRDVWEYRSVTTEHQLLCIVLRHECLRVSFYHFPAGLRKGDWSTPEAIHTARPVPTSLRHIFAALTEAAGQSMEMVRHLINAAAAGALEECRSAQRQSRGKALASFEQIRVYIDNNYMQPLLREHIAARFGLNHNYLSQLFRNVAGLSIHEYIEKRRLEVARDMLRNTRLTLKEIAAQTGFSGEVYFVRRFREVNGMPPGQYRLS